MSGRLAAVFAHPDDDAFGVAGTAATLAETGDLELSVVLATSGEGGRIADPSLATPGTLGRVREGEARASWRAAGVEPARLEFLRLPDGGLAGVPSDELAERIGGVLWEVRPEVVVTFGPDGVTGHDDHIAVGRATETAFHRARSAIAEGRGSAPAFLRLLRVALPQSRLDRLGVLLRERGMDPPDPSEPFSPRGVPDEAIGVSVDVSGAYRRKLEAIRAHRTQAEIDDLPEDLWPAILSEEHFVHAWPERPLGAPVLRNVFEGLGDA